MNRSRLPATILLSMLLVSGASAHDPDSLETPVPEPTPRHSVFVNPLTLIRGFYEVLFAFDDAGRRTFAFIGAVGVPEPCDCDDVAWAIGSQVSWYLLGDFDHGLQAGVQLAYSDIGIRGFGTYYPGRGVGLVPFAGYKVRIHDGLTLQAQGGLGLRWGDRTFARDLLGATAGVTPTRSFESEEAYLLNVGIGWSF